jgi:dihydroorotase
VADAKRRGLPVTCEVTPSHLYLTEDAVFGPGPEPLYETNAKINPPLRTEADRRALLAGVNSGIIDAIATDHAPHAVEDKLCEFDDAAFGISCIETALGTVATLVDRGELQLPAAIRALSAGPAATFAFPAHLGTLSAGARDITVFDPGHRWTVDVARFASKGRNTPLAGAELTGIVALVVRDGAIAFEQELAGV